MKRHALILVLGGIALLPSGLRAQAQAGPAAEEAPSETPVEEQHPREKWVSPPAVSEESRQVKYTVHAGYLRDAQSVGRALSILDFSAKRKLDEYSVMAEGLLRVQKGLSSSDAAEAVEIRLARLTLAEPWFQAQMGRFDLFPFVSPNLFFGSYPTMGARRVDGGLAVLPLFFKFGSGEEATHSAPIALSAFYTPSLFSSDQAQFDRTQSFFLAQARFKVSVKDVQVTFRVNGAKTKTNFFEYSSLNGKFAYSVGGDLVYARNYTLSAEYGAQNGRRPGETSVLSGGFRLSRIGTWGSFSMDELALEGQAPVGKSMGNPFTGGNSLIPALASTPRGAWYAKARFRWKVAFLEAHATNSQDDYTLARLDPSAVKAPFTGSFGPGNETDDAGIPLRSPSYNRSAYFLRMGVVF